MCVYLCLFLCCLLQSNSFNYLYSLTSTSPLFFLTSFPSGCHQYCSARYAVITSLTASASPDSVFNSQSSSHFPLLHFLWLSQPPLLVLFLPHWLCFLSLPDPLLPNLLLLRYHGSSADFFSSIKSHHDPIQFYYFKCYLHAADNSLIYIINSDLSPETPIHIPNCLLDTSFKFLISTSSLTHIRQKS